MKQGRKRGSSNANVLYAVAVAIWIVAIWVTAFYVANVAVADESAGVGGNSFLLGCSLATAGVLTIFSAREFVGAYKACFATEGENSSDAVGSGITKENDKMTKLGLFITLEAKAGQEEQLAAFLRNALPLVEAEQKTASWFAIQLAPAKFGIFDTFSDEDGREAHLSGEVARALMGRASDLLARAPSIEKLEVLAEKLPGLR
jgi:quinol monooxygenase YgiN